jgi:deoxyadenosine/deoxycytidine kinase
MCSTKSLCIISIEGNIGAGKTTILKRLQDKMAGDKNIIFLLEPVDLWETMIDPITGDNILQSFYRDPHKYAFTFQVMAYSTRLANLREIIRQNPECSVIICERSLTADKNIFAQMLYDDGKMDDLQFQVYNKFYTEYADDFHLDGIIYIDTSTETCYNRIKKRSRTGEDEIEFEYLKKCNDYHDKWLNPDNTRDTDIYRIDANVDVTYNNDEGTVWLHDIEQYIYSQIQK